MNQIHCTQHVPPAVASPQRQGLGAPAGVSFGRAPTLLKTGAQTCPLLAAALLILRYPGASLRLIGLLRGVLTFAPLEGGVGR